YVITTLQCCSVSLFASLIYLSTSQVYPLSLHDALPISGCSRVLRRRGGCRPADQVPCPGCPRVRGRPRTLGHPGQGTWSAGLQRSEEHTSELQSRFDLVCRLLLEKKKRFKSIL